MKPTNKFWFIVLGAGYGGHLSLFCGLIYSIPEFVMIQRFNDYGEGWLEVVLFSIITILFPVAWYKLVKGVVKSEQN